MSKPKLVSLTVRRIGRGHKWHFGVATLEGEDIVFFRVAGRKLAAGNFTEDKEERKPEIGESLWCNVENYEGRLRAVQWAFTDSAGGVR